MDKATIRSLIKQLRQQFPSQQQMVENENIMNQVLRHPLFLKSKTIGIYVSLPQEVSTLLLIQKALQTHRVCVPKVQGDIMHFYDIHDMNDLKPGHFHVLEPIGCQVTDPKDIDLMIVPLLAYDQKCYRVGYGKGYYDKYFQNDFCGYKLGLAFSYQYVEHIDYDDFDIPLDEIITYKEDDYR